MKPELAHLIEKVSNSTNYTVQFVQKDNFTFCSVFDFRTSRAYYGFSKRNPVDPFIPERGRQIALARAAREMLA